MNRVFAGGFRRVYIVVQNEGTLTEHFTLCACGGAGDSTGITFRYFRGSDEITAAVEAGTYVSPSVVAGDKVRIRVRIDVSNAATLGSQISKLVTATSAHTSDADTVGMLVQRK